MTEKILPDLQNQEDLRNIAIDRVGITNVYFPIKVKRKPIENKEKYKLEYDEVSAKVDLFVGLPHDYRGVNMSRFYECLMEFSRHTISLNSMPDLLVLLQEKLKSKDAYARFEFDYYVDKTAPVSKKVAPMAYRCAFTGVKKNGVTDFILEVNVVAASICPCSKLMSTVENLNYKKDFGFSDIDITKIQDIDGIDRLEKAVGMGAHNQRSNIRVQIIIKDKEFVWVEDLVEIIEAQASAPTYPILKRPDEKYVTELGYSQSKFSEDIARDIHITLQSSDRIVAFSVKVENEESIHPYNCTSYTHSDNWNYHV